MDLSERSCYEHSILLCGQQFKMKQEKPGKLDLFSFNK
jgi:hypothetical protein